MTLADPIERDVVSLDTPLRSRLPDTRLPLRGRPITTRDLVTHRSGLPRLPPDFNPSDGTDPLVDYDGRALLVSPTPLEPARDPGETYEYSNLAGLLGCALSQRAGRTWEQLISERITGPLRMPDTLLSLSAVQRTRPATGHDDGRAGAG